MFAWINDKTTAACLSHDRPIANGQRRATVSYTRGEKLLIMIYFD